MFRSQDKALAKPRELYAPTFHAPTFDVYGVPQPECADFLRQHGFNAFSPAELDYAYAIPGDEEDASALVFDEAHRCDADLRQRGISTVYATWTPAPFRFLSEWLRSRQAIYPLLPISDWVSMRADIALVIRDGVAVTPPTAPKAKVVIRGR